ncbi:chorion protein 19 [Musca autumnalis]|uniref:chorion protein 19 n=1 Tax=Musca autumnalis TaxID=221902 RepID=UPI003CEB05EB
MNKYICFATIILAAIASVSCSGYSAGYAGDAAAYGSAPNYQGYSGYSAPAPSYGGSYAAAAPKSYGQKYSFQPAYSTELYPGQNGYKQYNSHPTYSQVALPVVQDAPLAKLYSPAAKSYGHGQAYGGHSSYGSQAAY